LGREEDTRPWGKPLSREPEADLSCAALLFGPLPGAEPERALESMPLPMGGAGKL